MINLHVHIRKLFKFNIGYVAMPGSQSTVAQFITSLTQDVYQHICVDKDINCYFCITQNVLITALI